MLSINTNLSSLVAQSSLKESTNALTLAIERMTTGLKINHASDNAANYSISTNMTTQIGAYDVAADNVAMGMDLVMTANDTISLMQDKAERLRALSTQARNGTYGAQSLAALNTEAGAIIAEIHRLYSTAEYNDISLFNRKAYELSAEHKALCAGVKAKAEYNGFITDPITYTDEQLVEMLANNEIKPLDNSVTSFTSGQKYLISDKAELKRLAELVNNGKDSTGAVFILGADIDLGGEEWTPIGDFSTDTSYQFKGIFDGNGHVISGLTINRPTEDYVGLFGHVSSGSIKNVGIEDGTVKGASYTGGLVGYFQGTIYNGTFVLQNCYTDLTVVGNGDYVGGLCGQASKGPPCNVFLTDCYALGAVTGQQVVGGLVGSSSSSISNSYATGDVTGQQEAGGLVGSSSYSSIANSYATGTVSGTSSVGGLVGSSYSSIVNSYATGTVSGTSSVGGLVGFSVVSSSSIINTYASGAVTGQSYVGGLVGHSSSSSSISASSFYGTVSGNSAVGNVIGLNESVNIANCEYIKSVDYAVGSGINSADSFTEIVPKQVSTTLQVGITGDSSCQISFDTNFDYDISVLDGDIGSDAAFKAIDDFINLLSEKSTEIGAIQNRLESAIESIEVNLTNLTSSRSTIRDADIAEVSAEYIQKQILQQASATLMATANQSPSIALQLI